MQTAKKKPLIILFEAKGELDFPENFNREFHTHLLCHRGFVEFHFKDQKMKCKSGEFLFWFAESRLTDLKFSKGFKASVLLVEKDFLYDNIPDQNLGIDATLYSRDNPIFLLNNKQDKDRILSDFSMINERFLDGEHRFYDESLRLQMKLFILGMWHTFAEALLRKRTTLSGTLYERFMQLLEIHCLQKREVQFYADYLHITAKHLNYVCKSTSDITASKWIQRFARERIELLLQNKTLNISEIADEMEFSSRSFFTRYVKKVLGVTPREFRNRLG